jgi:hypothetical protein
MAKTMMRMRAKKNDDLFGIKEGKPQRHRDHRDYKDIKFLRELLINLIDHTFYAFDQHWHVEIDQ